MVSAHDAPSSPTVGSSSRLSRTTAAQRQSVTLIYGMAAPGAAKDGRTTPAASDGDGKVSGGKGGGDSSKARGRWPVRGDRHGRWRRWIRAAHRDSVIAGTSRRTRGPSKLSVACCLRCRATVASASVVGDGCLVAATILIHAMRCLATRISNVRRA